MEHVKPTILDQIVISLSKGHVQRQQAMMIDATLPSTKKDQVEQFQKKAKQILSGISPQTVPIQIEC